MKRIFGICITIGAIILFAAISFAQTAEKPDQVDKSYYKVLEERVKNIDEKVADNKAEIKDDLDNKFRELNTRMLIYVGFVVAIIAFIGFFLNFFGKKSIRNWVDEKVNEIAKEQLDARLEPIYIKYKDERTKELEERWESRLKEIEIKWTDYEQSMKKAMLKIEKEKGFKSITEIPSEEFKQLIEKIEEVKEEREYSAYDWIIKARSEKSKGNHEKAIELYSKVIKLDPKNSLAYNNRGFSYDILKEHEKAIEDYNKSFELEPSDYLPLSNLATTQIILGNYEDALKSVEQALTLDLYDEAWATLYYKKCIITKLLGLDITESEKDFAAALEREFALNFSFYIITDWLSEVDLPTDTKEFIEEKTEMLKKKKK